MDRLDKFLCGSGAGTRSQVKLILKAGRVTVDGRPEKDGSQKIDPQTQTVTLDGEALGGKRRLVVMLNKPAGYVTATEDAQQKTVMELLPKQQINIVVETSKVDKILDIIKKELYTGHIGDGKIFVYSIDNVIRVRTGDEGLEAI